MKVALCCIIKNENRYIVEFVKHHKALGFNKIFIYDNNNDEHPETVLKKYIDSNFVEIINYREKSVCQLEAYEHCYNTHKNDFDFIAFFDCDEFLVLQRHKTVQQFLSDDKYNMYSVIVVNCIVYGDNELLHYDGRNLSERFTLPSTVIDENVLVKSFVRCTIDDFKWNTPNIPYTNSHVPSLANKISVCNTNGKLTFLQPTQQNILTDVAYLRHYKFKTCEEFMYRRLSGYPDQKYKFNFIENVEQFFKFNKFTFEKLQIMIDIYNKFIQTKAEHLKKMADKMPKI